MFSFDEMLKSALADKDKANPPEPGTERYKRQVETMFEVCSHCDTKAEASQMMLNVYL